MAFWTDGASVDPKRNFRFKIIISGFSNRGEVSEGTDATSVWWAKKVQKPNFTIAEAKHVFLGHSYYYPGKLEWQEITMTLVDPVSPNALAILNDIVDKSGYKIPDPNDAFETMGKVKSTGQLGSIQIIQIDADDNAIETWTLKNPFLKKISYSELDYENDLWKIPANRMKAGKEHLVPLTDPMKEILEQLRRFNGHEEYVFRSHRGRKKPHIDESALNQLLKRLGYGGRQTAHGLRQLPATAGQDVLKTPYEIIQRQLAHAVGNKIRQAYDKSQMLEERRDFMNKWCSELVHLGLKI